ncbi:unnamed protein product [Adineta steineri]|uniref:Uncharacterized protein n=1 Tax=Adineta steineri TaxID=433720 RepID=A0A814RW46_9BILA|nr:unnamed protein product [Adineta steineri]CAF1434903.1 unnamed protein product [Adineta steineri]
MGCKQTRTTPSAVVNVTSSFEPVYVKSALKNSRSKGKGKTERLSMTEQDIRGRSKSVNFDEKVEVKLRTPTPGLYYDNEPTSRKVGRSQSFESDDNSIQDVDSVVSSASSQDTYNEHYEVQIIPHPSSRQRKNSNEAWSNSNTVVSPPINKINAKTIISPSLIQHSTNNTTVYPIENPHLPNGQPLKVRRQVSNAVAPQSSRTVISPESYPVSSTRPNVQSTSHITQRPLPNTNAVVVEHHGSFSNNESSSQPAYYAFSRRTTENRTSTKT